MQHLNSTRLNYVRSISFNSRVKKINYKLFRTFDISRKRPNTIGTSSVHLKINYLKTQITIAINICKILIQKYIRSVITIISNTFLKNYGPTKSLIFLDTSRISTCTLTCCQWSSSDGWAEKYPVSCMSCSSRNILPLGRSVSMATRDYEGPSASASSRRWTSGGRAPSSKEQIQSTNWPSNQPTNQQVTNWHGEPRRERSQHDDKSTRFTPRTPRASATLTATHDDDSARTYARKYSR